MLYKDVVGNLLSDGDLVAVGAQGIIIGTVRKTSSLINADPNAQPIVEVEVIFTLPANQTGIVGGVIKVARTSQQSAGEA